MSSSAKFEPLYPAHAIERCTATIAFDSEIPAKAFESLVSRSAEVLRDSGLKPAGQQLSVKFDFTTGQATPVHSGGPQIYSTPDDSIRIVISQNSISFMTIKYIRWNPFIGLYDRFISQIVDEYIKIVSISWVQLEYIDKFIWTGTWSDFSWSSLIRRDAGFVAQSALRSAREWHCHTGWFDNRIDIRRLINVNVDVQEVVHRQGPKPSVAILTLLRDAPPLGGGNALSSAATSAGARETLQDQHVALKKLLAGIILPTVSDSIGLGATS